MFDKNLFFALCEKYNVELSDSAKKPMLKDRNGVHLHFKKESPESMGIAKLVIRKISKEFHIEK